MIASESDAVMLAALGIFTVGQLLEYGAMVESLAKSIRKSTAVTSETGGFQGRRHYRTP
jgi:hypothetical protein